MRISRIKFAGFKSFLEPTTLHLPENLTAIVGPNGCGKSNIIDAVLWVLGESSAKHLRGEALTDVIFNGSNSRQPVGQASVEVIFDNSDGAIGGKYASFNEVSIKRVIDREGVSTFYLNGTRCRRRDITHLFLGTGIGRRSYSVIEQGMISRVVEARPEELRGFLEEAAGISKYKERRRETENRIRHTRENLSRISDIREELDKQIEKLKRQARAAERFKELRSQQRRLEAQSLVLRLSGLERELEQRQQHSRQQEAGVEQAMAELRSLEKELEVLHQEHTEATGRFNEAQGRFYGVGAEISRLEQKLQHHRERVEALAAELQAASAEREDAREHLSRESRLLQETRDQLEALSPMERDATERERTAYTAYATCEQAMRNWQAQWESFSQAAAEKQRGEQVQLTRQSHLQQGLERLEQRLERYREELKGLSLAELEQERDTRSAALGEVRGEHDRLLKEQERRHREIIECRNQLHEMSARLKELRATVHARQGHLAALEGLQAAALQRGGPGQEWLQRHGLEQLPRLARSLQVETGWERAVETVLGEQLEALCVEELESLAPTLMQLEQGRIAALARSGKPAGTEGTLAGVVMGEWAPWPLLSRIRIAASREEALAVRSDLGPGESVVTRDGLWLGPDWLVFHPAEVEDQGMLEREREIRRHRQELEQLQARSDELEEAYEALRHRLVVLEEEHDATARKLHEVQEVLRRRQGELATLEARLTQGRRRREELEAECQALEGQLRQDQAALADAERLLQVARQENSDLALRRQALEAERERLQRALQQARDNWQQCQGESHRLALERQSLESRMETLERALQRNRQLLEQLEARCHQLQEGSEQAAAPIAGMEQQLRELLEQRLQAEQELNSAREAVQALDNRLRESEQARSAIDQRIQERRDLLEQARVAQREVEVAIENLRQQLAGTSLDPQELLAELEQREPRPDEEGLAAEIEAVERRIQRLGAINLAAIEEYRQESERKEYIDAQYADLSEALETLERAIQKIDRETRSRFKETFDRVNSGLQSLFPRLFGGGHAYLELTSDDLLEAGVTVMARPPGKRNSTIHLLSGGEKALTAVAFVFAIFKLNPAPFCIMDEVDAPLDDANVGRLCDIVRAMSDEIQFVIITHNKITMEMANQLIGVTMQEAGVSRLVAVDMDRAMKMAVNA